MIHDGLLILYSILDSALIVFLIMQYRNLLKSEEYESDTLTNKFIVACLAILGIVFIAAILVLTLYYVFAS